MRPAISYFIDTLCGNFVEGWALSRSGAITIEVVVDGRIVGTAVTGVPRPDVGAAFPEVAGSAESGFVFAFGDEDLQRTTGDPMVWLLIRDSRDTVETERLEVPSIRPRPDGVAAVRSCLPRRVTDAVLGRSPELERGDLTSEGGALEAVNVIADLLRRGPRPLPGLHHYLGYVRSMIDSAMFVATHFPRANRRPTGEEDRYGMLTNPFEVTSIAHHLYVLDDYQVPGVVLEFGCYKGYSTSILSRACHHLGRTLEVFDSFEGLPASASQFYRPGEFAGDFEEVRQNVEEFGRRDVVEFHRGFFADTMPTWTPRPVMCMWMDVDLERSAADALLAFENLDRRGVLFSHECHDTTFVAGRPVPQRGPDDVVGPIVDAFANQQRPTAGAFLVGCTGAFWDAGAGIPVMPHAAFDRLLAVARQ